MGRRPKHTKQEQEQMFERILKGEKPADIAREFGLTKGRVSQMYAQRTKEIKETAERLACVEGDLSKMPLSDQIMVRNLAEELKSISMNLASAGRYGASVAHRLNAIAHGQMEQVDDLEPEKSTRQLQNIAVLTKIANSSAEIGLKLLGANKEAMTAEDEPPAPLGITFVVKSARKTPADV